MNQPYLHDLVVALSAPVQAWSAHDGQIEPDGAQGIYCGDDRVLGRASLAITGHELVPVTTTVPGGSRVRFEYVVRTPELGIDPQVMVERTRVARADGLDEHLVVSNGSERPIELELVMLLDLDATSMGEVKAGLRANEVPMFEPGPGSAAAGSWHWRDASTTASLEADQAQMVVDGGQIRLVWPCRVAGRERAEISWHLELRDAAAPFVAAIGAGLQAPRIDPDGGTSSLQRLLDTSLADLQSLSMAEADRPDQAFLAAGSPWFLTLFGRDSLIAARLLEPWDAHLAATTLRVLAHRQGRANEVETAEQPGKILHEVRRVELDLHETQPGEAQPGEQQRSASVLPPEYYGTVDATPLWIELFVRLFRRGKDGSGAGGSTAPGRPDVTDLLPNFECALDWLANWADPDGDGFLEYFDASGHGLANQGWKDSGDSIRWADGTRAKGPIALAEVQGYAHAAALGAAEVFDDLGRTDQAEYWRDWARGLAERFRAQFWVSDALGPYPALALDADKRPVDGVASNMGHLLGTGILSPDEVAVVVRRLMDPSMFSGYGVRTLSTTNAGYWPLGYHVGSVWTHDTAMVIDGMLREGCSEQARTLAAGLLRAGEGFDHRMPELFGGASADQVFPPQPYPASCRPQAWAAASSVVVARALGALG